MTHSQLAAAVANDFYEGKLDLSARGVEQAGWSEMPEVKAVHELRESGQTERTVRQFLTFVAAMDRARDATRLWRDASKMLATRRGIFDPEEVSTMPIGRLREVLANARVSQRHKQDVSAWRTIARSLYTGEGAVAHLVEHGEGDAVELLKDLGSTDHARKPRYPLLRGPKIGPMWIRIVAAPGGAKINNMDVVPVAVDVQVRKITENLGVADTVGLPPEVAKPIIQCAWQNAVGGAKICGPRGIAGTCAALDPALWFYGKHGCGHCKRVRRRVPIGSACQSCQYAPDDMLSPDKACSP